MKKLIPLMGLLALTPVFTSCDLAGRVESVAAHYNQLEDEVIALRHQNIEQKATINQLRSELVKMQNDNKLLEMQIAKTQTSSKGRAIASIAPELPVGEEDYVKFHVYHWKVEQLHAMAMDEFKKKNYNKAAQYYRAMSLHYPQSPLTKTDEYLFEAGIAAFEAAKYPEWVEANLNQILNEHPTSKYYRGAKVWLGLNHLRAGRSDKFLEMAEEFRKKYRNTPEWALLSVHYEKIIQDHKPKI